MALVGKNGGSQAVLPGQQVSVLEIRSSADCGALWNISTNIESVDPAMTNLELVGVLNYGNNWHRQNVEFDWSHGLNFSVGADGLRLDCRNDSPSGQPAIIISATSSFDSTNRKPPVLRSFKAVVNDLEIIEQIVPSLAVEVEYQRALPPGHPFYLHLIDYAGVVVMSQLVNSFELCRTMRIPNNVKLVRATAVGPDAPIPGRFIFWLSL